METLNSNGLVYGHGVLEKQRSDFVSAFPGVLAQQWLQDADLAR